MMIRASILTVICSTLTIQTAQAQLQRVQQVQQIEVR